jgi:hypothetical protein
VDEVAAADLALKERIPVSRLTPGGSTGRDALESLERPHIELKTRAIEAANKAKWASAPNTPKVADSVSKLKSELIGEIDGDVMVAKVDAWYRQFLDRFSKPVFRGGKKVPGARAYRKLTAQELDDEVLKFQQQADYAKESDDPTQVLKERFARAMGTGIRGVLRDIPVPIGRTGQTAGSMLGKANDRLSELHIIDKPLAGAERRAANAPILPNVLSPHGVAPMIGAGAGFAAGHSPGAAAAGAGLAYGADALFTNPAVGSRLSLAATHPVSRAIQQQAPRAALTGLDVLFGPGWKDTKPDSTGGTR